MFYAIQEYLNLWLLRIQVALRNTIEYAKVVFYYYSLPSFFKIDTSLLSAYLGRSPFCISKQFLLQKGEKDIYTYGETPLTTFEYIVTSCSITAQDKVFELGCGRGRHCFWLHQFIGCSVVGVEYVPFFVQQAHRIQEKYQLKGIEFRQEDILQTDLTGATVIYLYGTCFNPSFIEALVQRFAQLPKGTKIITISYSLLEYVTQAPFKVTKQFPALFTWGVANVYLHMRI